MLIELTDISGQVVWINPEFVVRVDWASAETCIVTLGVVQEFNAKVRPLSVTVHLPARQVVDILNGKASLPKRKAAGASDAKP